jgi:hypothetical protein
MKQMEQNMVTDQDLMLISDLHKDARGFRPSPAFWARWKTLARPEQEKIFMDLSAELEHTLEQERLQDQAAVDAFELRIRALMGSGALTRKEAIRQMVRAISPDIIDGDFACYRLGLPYAMAAEIQEAIR